MSVCSGAYLLAKAGLLDNTKCTTHFGAIDGLLRLAPTAQIQRNVRYVESGDIITTAGITSGIDGALRLLEKFSSPADAATVAKVMEYKFKAGGAVEGLPSSE
jgi:transcriptional regulator GlxA family with amidase domain